MKRIILFFIILSLFSAAQNISQTRGAKWQYATGDFIESSPAVGEGHIYIGSADGFLYSFDIYTGLKEWSFNASSPVRSSPSYLNGIVYFGDDNGVIRALNSSDGTLIWKFNASGKIRSRPVPIAAGYIFVTSTGGSLYCLNASTGTYLWEFMTEDKIYSTPYVVAGVVYFGSKDGMLYAVNASTGEEVWSYLADGPILTSPEVVNNIVYFGTYEGSVYAVDAFTGEKRWSFETNGPVIASPTVARGILWIGSDDGNVYALDAHNGNLLWSRRLGKEVESKAFYNEYGDVIYLGCNDKNLYALDVRNGSTRWKYETGDWILSSPLFYNGIVYFGSYDGVIYAVSTISSHITSPTDGQMINGSTFVIRGSAFADAGVKRVEVRFGNELNWRLAIGAENWSYTWPIARLSGPYAIYVRTTDNMGNVEIEPYTSVSIIVSQEPHAFEKPMYVSFPKEAAVGDKIIITVQDADGNPVPFVKVEMDGRVYYGDKNGMVSQDPRGHPIIVPDKEGELTFTVTKTGYYIPDDHPRLAIKIYKPDYTPYIIAGAAIIILGAIIYVWKKMQEPEYG